MTPERTSTRAVQGALQPGTVVTPSAVAAAAGVLIAMQAQLNAALGLDMGAPLAASLLSFIGGTLTLLLWTAAAGRLQIRLVLRSRRVRPWWLFGGVSAAVLVTAAAAFVPVIGLSLLAISVVTGQLIGSLIVDWLGLTPGARRLPTPARVVAALLAICALVLGSSTGAAQVDVPISVLLALVGFALSFGAAANGRLRDAFQDSGLAALVNFLVALACVAAVVANLILFHDFAFRPPSVPPWIYLGGPLGAIWVALSARLVSRLGVLRLYLASVAGQLVGSLLLDVMAPLAPTPLTPSRVAGMALVAAAVLLASTRSCADCS